MESSSDFKRFFKDIVLVSIISAVMFLALSFSRPLANPDEGRYSEIPREMAASADYVTPRLNDLQYFYKPPMFYWMQAGAIKAFGVNTFSLRLANSLMAVLGIALTYWAAGSLFGRRAGLLASAALLTSLFYFALGNIVTLDMTVSVFISGALFSFIVAYNQNPNTKKRFWLWVLMFVFCALACLTKGLIGIVLPFAAIFIYLALTPVKSIKSFTKSDVLAWALGVAVFFLIAAPWHVLAAVQNPAYENAAGLFSKNPEGQGFAWYYFINEHFLRYLDAETSHRYQPFWFFFVLAPVGFIPWVAFLPRIAANCAKKESQFVNREKSNILFFAIWAAFIILFFSISKSKLVPYIIPIYPALAAIVGAWLSRVWDNGEKTRAERLVLASLGVLASVAIFVAYMVLSAKGKLLYGEAAAPSFAAAAVIFLAGSVLLFYFTRKNRAKPACITIFATLGAFLFLFNPIAKNVQRADSRDFANIIKAAGKPGDTVLAAYCYNEVQDLPVWLGEFISVLDDVPNEQSFGLMREPKRIGGRIVKFSELEKTLAEKRVFLIAKKRNIEKLSKIKGFDSLEKLAEKGELIMFASRKIAEK